MAEQDMTMLSNKKCKPCEIGATPFTMDRINEFLTVLKDWELKDNTKIKREFKFMDCKESMAFVSKVAQIAEAEVHHPAIFISYKKVRITLSTHSIGGLSENDFIMAEKINKINKG